MAPRGETRERILRLYFHFPEGKEQLASESVALSGRTVGGALAEAVLSARDGRAGIAALGEHFARDLLESGFSKGCPVATVALEAAAESETIRAACDAAYGEWQREIAAALRGWGVPGGRAEPLAALVLSSLQGAVMLARVRRDVSGIHEVTRQLGELVHQETTWGGSRGRAERSTGGSR